jgi:hypothetical protein
MTVLIPEDPEQPHRYGGRIRILGIERYGTKVVVKWRITLEPDPDQQLAAYLEGHGHDSEDRWDTEGISQHVQLIDALKLTVFRHSFLVLTDDVGTDDVCKRGSRFRE